MLKYAVDINKYKNRDQNADYHEEYQYLNLLKDLMEHGTLEEGRNGKTKRGVGSAMHFSLKGGKIPVFTTKKTAVKTGIRELLWFIKGDTNIGYLQENGVRIWNEELRRFRLSNETWGNVWKTLEFTLPEGNVLYFRRDKPIKPHVLFKGLSNISNTSLTNHQMRLS